MTLSHRATSAESVVITAPARLHLGFIDLNGGLGRRFGSFGLALDQPFTRVRLRRRRESAACGPDSERALRYSSALFSQLQLPEGVDITVEQAIPPHCGLGSGTQMALAVGLGITRLYGLGLATQEIATRLSRGARSGIGIGAFEQGGFLVDGGHGPRTRTPPLIARLAVPETWRLILIFDHRAQGIHGVQEQHAFAELPEFSALTAAHLSRLLIMQALPALAEFDCTVFGAAITEIQRQIGNYFAPLQGGRFTSDDVASVLEWFDCEGACGIGQSSWGPTGFALYADETESLKALALAREQWSQKPHLEFLICQARNRAGVIESRV